MEYFLLLSGAHYSKTRSHARRLGASKKLPTKLVLAKGKNPVCYDILDPVEGPYLIKYLSCNSTFNSSSVDESEVQTSLPNLYTMMELGSAVCLSGKMVTPQEQKDELLVNMYRYEVTMCAGHDSPSEVVKYKQTFEFPHQIDFGRFVDSNGKSVAPMETCTFPEQISHQGNPRENPSKGVFPFKLVKQYQIVAFEDPFGSGFLISEHNINHLATDGKNLALLSLEGMLARQSDFGGQYGVLVAKHVEVLMHIKLGHSRRAFSRKKFPVDSASMKDEEYLKDAHLMMQLSLLMFSSRLLMDCINPYVQKKLESTKHSRRQITQRLMASLQEHFATLEGILKYESKFSEAGGSQRNITELIKHIRKTNTMFVDCDRLRSGVNICCRRDRCSKDAGFLKSLTNLGLPDARKAHIDLTMAGGGYAFWRTGNNCGQIIKQLVQYGLTNSFGVVLEPKPWSHKLNVRKIYLGQLDTHTAFGKHYEVGMLLQFQSSLPSLVVLDTRRKLVRSWQIEPAPPGFRRQIVAKMPKKFQLIMGYTSNGFIKNIGKLRLVQIPHPDTWEAQPDSELQITEFPVESQSGIILGVHHHKAVVIYSSLQYRIPIGAIRIFRGSLNRMGINAMRDVALTAAVNLPVDATVEDYFGSVHQANSTLNSTHMLVASKTKTWSDSRLIIFGFNHSSSQPVEGVWKSIPLATGYGSDYCKVMLLSGYLVALLLTVSLPIVVVYHRNSLHQLTDLPSLGALSIANSFRNSRLLATDFQELLLVQLINNNNGHIPTSPKSKRKGPQDQTGAAQTICYRLKLV